MANLYKDKIDKEIYEQIKATDCSRKKKYTKWLFKQYLKEQFDIDSVSSYLIEYEVLVDRNLIAPDINSFKTLEDFKKGVDRVNNQKSATRKELENNFDIILDNDDLLLIRPNSYEASRKLGLSVFKHRNNEVTGQQDSAWCTTYSNDNHWNDYYYKNNVTFYYCKVKNTDILNDYIKRYDKFTGDINIFAIAVLLKPEYYMYDLNDYLLTKNAVVDIYDANDVRIDSPIGLINYLDITKYITPHNVDKREEEKNDKLKKLLYSNVINGNYILTKEVYELCDPDMIKCHTINGNLTMMGMFEEFPEFFSKLKVNGSFNCQNNKITSLKGLPVVTKDINVSNNLLISLEHSPEMVNGTFSCSGNLIESLEYAPKIVDEDFICAYNKIKNLVGSPEFVGGKYFVIHNQLESLKGSPKEILKEFNCSYNHLETLKYAPFYVGTKFNCSNNFIKNLKYSPEIVKNSYDCSNNKLENLYGCTKEVEYIDCRKNNLFSLKGLPICKTINASDNKISSLKYLHDIEYDILNFYNNCLESLEGIPDSIGTLNCECNIINTLEYLPIFAEKINLRNNLLTHYDVYDYFADGSESSINLVLTSFGTFIGRKFKPNDLNGAVQMH